MLVVGDCAAAADEQLAAFIQLPGCVFTAGAFSNQNVEGRDVSGLLIATKSVIGKYKYICLIPPILSNTE